MKTETKPDEVPTRTTRLIDLIDYQEGSVVSKTLIKKKTGTITLFAFDEGEGLSEHTAPHEAFVFLIDGAADITISGTVFRLQAGESIIMPAHQPHAVKAGKKFKMLLTMIRDDPQEGG
ncbi:MAG: cupin domain-containing protein [bacterium]